jgi:hypothetical protein
MNFWLEGVLLHGGKPRLETALSVKIDDRHEKN